MNESKKYADVLKADAASMTKRISWNLEMTG
jgi:hypothetical protein